MTDSSKGKVKLRKDCFVILDTKIRAVKVEFRMGIKGQESIFVLKGKNLRRSVVVFLMECIVGRAIRDPRSRLKFNLYLNGVPFDKYK